MEAKMLVLLNHEEVREARNRQEDLGGATVIPEKKFRTVPYVFRLNDVVDVYPTQKERMIIGFKHKEIEVIYEEPVFKTIRGYLNSLDPYALIHLQ